MTGSLDEREMEMAKKTKEEAVGKKNEAFDLDDDEEEVDDEVENEAEDDGGDDSDGDGDDDSDDVEEVDPSGGVQVNSEDDDEEVDEDDEEDDSDDEEEEDEEEGKKWRSVPYLARKWSDADDLRLYNGSDYFDDAIIDDIQKGDVALPPDNTKKQLWEAADFFQDPSTVKFCRQPAFADLFRDPTTMYFNARCTQQLHELGIVHERHNVGIPILQICDVELQHGSTYAVVHSWKLVEVTDKGCKLEIKLSYKGEDVKETVRFCFPANDTDKLLYCFVGGYKVSYRLHTDAIRLRLQLEIPDSFTNFPGEVYLKIERDGIPYTIHFLSDQTPTKELKLSPSGNGFELSITRNVPRNLHHCMKLFVESEDSSGMLNVHGYHRIFSYKIPVDQEDYFRCDNGLIKIKIFWGCCVGDGKGLCTEVCTCEPAEFIGFCRPGEGDCSKDTEK